MTGATHRAGGMLMSVVGFWVLKENNLLLPNVNEGLQLLVMYPFTMWGSVASDLDHHWDSAPVKDMPSRCINRVLHLTTPIREKMDNAGGVVKKSPLYHILGLFDASHRSWQTHSDLTLASIIGLLYLVLHNKLPVNLGTIDLAITAIILMGICLGFIAHLLLDMITPSGIWSTVFVGINKGLSFLTHKHIHILPEKIRFVPQAKFFATGGTWETIIRKLLKLATLFAVLYILTLLFPLQWQSIKGSLPFF